MANRLAKTAKAAIGSLLATSMLATAVPASAQYRDRHRDHDGISAGEIIAGAVIVGGLAAILSGGGRDRHGRYDGDYYRGGDWDYDWRRYGGSRRAIEQCVSAVERRGRGDDIDVRRITDVQRIRDGYRVQGRVTVDYRDGRYDRWGHDGRWDRDDRWNRGGRWDRDDRYGYGRQRYDDRGRFNCIVRYGRVRDVDFRGI
jgi:hypothetical protein